MDEINRQPFFNIERKQFRLRAARTQRQVKFPVHAPDFREPFADAAIKRRDNPRLVICVHQRLAERADHVGQAAGLGERMNFAAGEQNFHRIKR